MFTVMARTDRRNGTSVRETHRFPDSTRVDQAWFDKEAETIECLFPDGVRWVYQEVLPATWQRFVRSGSPGRFIRDILEQHPNGPA